MAARLKEVHSDEPARVRFRELPLGHRNDKFTAITALNLDDDGWVEASREWRASFLPEAAEAWAGYPPLERLFDYDGSGVMPGRTWVIAPDRESLERRWNRLIGEKDAHEQAKIFQPHQGGDRTANKVVKDGLHGCEYRNLSVAKDAGNVITPVRYAFRSFDREWIIPDNRLINRPNPNLWRGYSDRQAYLTAWHRYSPSAGPALSFAGLIPDMDHYKGNFGGRVFPLWADAEATIPNVRADLLTELSLLNGEAISAEDVMAYIAAVAAHPGYTARFAADLRQPGLRIPVTADAKLFREAATLGREIIWLHTFGDRFADPKAGRPASPPRAENGPTIPKGGAIPTEPDKFPDSLSYDASKERLFVGEGYIDNVSPEVWAYEVSGMDVIKQWFSYRRKDRSRPIIGDRREPSPLNDIQPDCWLPEYTSELINVLHVLTRLIALESSQDDLLARIVDGPTHSREDLNDVLRAEN